MPSLRIQSAAAEKDLQESEARVAQNVFKNQTGVQELHDHVEQALVRRRRQPFETPQRDPYPDDEEDRSDQLQQFPVSGHI